MLLALMTVPNAAWAWWNDDWSFRTQITLDPTHVSPAPTTELKRVPVLVRLHEGNFKFLDARSDGTDLRFVAADDKTPLNYHIEAFDGVASLAYIWVDVPVIEARQAAGHLAVLRQREGDERRERAGHVRRRDGAGLSLQRDRRPAARPDGERQQRRDLECVSRRSKRLIRQGVQFNGSMNIRIAPSPSLSAAGRGADDVVRVAQARSGAPAGRRAILFTKLTCRGRWLAGATADRPGVRTVRSCA